MAVPPQVPVVKFVSPNKADRALVEFHNTSVASYLPLDLGTAHANTRDYPGYRLGKQFNLPSDEKWVIRVWVTDETDPTWWNWAEKFSSDSNSHPIFVRTFREPRKTYAPLTKGLPLKSVYKLALATAGTGYIPGTLPVLTFTNTGTNGTGAAGHAIVNQDGTIAELVLDHGGSGYTSAPTFAVAAPPAGGTTATGTAVIQPATALLVAEEAQQFPEDSEFRGLYLNVMRVFETLPGPYIPFTRYDDDLGPIQGRRRAVLNSGQAATLGATSKKTYEGRDASSIVSWEIEENWSDGTGSPGNPAYPIGKTDFYENDRGQVHQTSQVTTDTTSPGSLTVTAGVATQIRYEPFQENANLRKKIVETWVVPGPIQESTEFERDGVKKVVTRQQIEAADIVTDEDLTAGVLTRKFGERLYEVLAFQIIETITVIDGDLLDLPSFTTSILNLIPEIFRAQIPTHVESHIIEGTAAEPALDTGEFEHSERQMTPLYKEVRSTILDDIGSLPIVITGIKETNDKKQVVSVTMTLEVDSTTPTVPTATRDVDFKKLGNGLAIEIVRTVPDVFPEDSYTKSILNLIPEKFRAAIPLIETTIDSAGTPSTDPTLLTGEFSRTEGRLTEFTKRVRVTSLGTVTLPVVITGGKETDAKKQVVSVVYTLEADSTTPTVPTATRDVEFMKLGNGMAVETVRTVPDVFPEDSYTTSVLNLIPEKLRALIPVKESTVDSAGSPSTDPTLLTGELSRTEGRLTEFTKRVRLTKFDIGSLPIIITGIKETNDRKQVVSVTMTLEVDSTTPTTPTATRDVQFDKLGNGLAVEIVRTVPAVFPEDSYTKSILNLIPEKFRGWIPLTESTVDSAGAPSTDPTLLTGEFSRTEGRLTEFTKRVRITKLGTISLPVSVTDTDTNDQKQTVAVVHTLDETGSSTAVPTALIDVQVVDLGNGYEVETLRTIADIFDPASFTVAIPNLIPEIFRATIATHTEIHFEEGTASEPTLGTGEFQRSERQINEFVKEVRFEVLDDIGSLPIVITGQKETNQNKQVVTVSMKLCIDSTTPTTPTALIDVDFKKLGNGLAIEITRTIPSVFAATSATISIPDQLPPELQAAFPLTTTEVSSAGTAANPPTLGTGDIRKTESQIDAFVKRITTASRGSISFPATLELHETTSQFGGGDLKILVTVDDAPLTIDEGLLVVSSKAKPLGGGLYLRITESLNDTEWPELEGTKVDENLRLELPYTKQIVDPAAATGGVVGDTATEVEPIDKWKSITIASRIPDDLSELDVTYPTTRNHIFPDTLTDIELVEVWTSASSGDDSAFSYDAALKYKTLSGYRGPCDGQIIETYTTTPDVTSYPVTKFFPEEYLATLRFYWAAAGGGNAQTQARVFQFKLPSSLHDEFELTTDLSDPEATAEDLTIPATDPIALPTSGTLITVDRSTERWRFGIWRNLVTQIYVP